MYIRVSFVGLALYPSRVMASAAIHKMLATRRPKGKSFSPTLFLPNIQL